MRKKHLESAARHLVTRVPTADPDSLAGGVPIVVYFAVIALVL